MFYSLMTRRFIRQLTNRSKMDKLKYNYIIHIMIVSPIHLIEGLQSHPPNHLNASGAMIAVSTAFSPMPMPENAPAVSFT